MEEREQLIDEFYAAAFLPELWPQALEHITRLTGGYAAALFAFNDTSARWVGTATAQPIMQAYLEGGWQQHNTRATRAAALQYPGFVGDHDIFSLDEIEKEPIYVDFFRKFGLGWCVGTTIVAPSGDLLVLNIEREFDRGIMDTADVRSFNPLRPHLARSALMSARLRLERAQSATRTLEAVGLPAAVISADGRVLSVNSLLEGLGARVIARAHGRLGLADRAAGRLLDAAIARLDRTVEGTVASIPVPADESMGPPLIVHLVPVRREAHDLFARALGILVITPVIPGEASSTLLLQGLFDLSPAEAKVAKGIGSGETIETMAAGFGLSRETIRAQLKSVFAKTGTRRQAELAALLAGARPIGVQPTN
jgi:DNA-binding CsgD family transcriptional regulator